MEEMSFSSVDEQTNVLDIKDKESSSGDYISNCICICLSCAFLQKEVLPSQFLVFQILEYSGRPEKYFKDKKNKPKKQECCNI